MPFWKKDAVDDMLDDYNKKYARKKGGVTSIRDTQMDAMCLCVRAKWVLAASCILQFVLGLAVLGISSFVYNELDFSDTPAWAALLITCITLGTLVVIIAAVGLVGARSGSRPVIASYFLCEATLAGVTFGVAIYLWAESDRVGEYIDSHWERIQEMFETEVTQAEAEAWVRQQLVGAGVVFGLLLTSLLSGLGSAARMAGTGYTFVATCFTLGCIGVVSLGVGYIASGRVVPAIYILMYVSGAILIVFSITGAIGAAKLNRECLSTCFCVLLAGVIVYFYVASFAYEQLTLSSKHAEELALTLAMGLVSGFWSLLALVLGLVFMFESRTSMREAEGKQMTAIDRITASR